MRILVLSDSHNDKRSLLAVLRLHPEAEIIVFLGDGENEFDSPEVQGVIKGKEVYAVQGNCDPFSVKPTETVFMADDKTVYILHGHTKAVKYGLDTLVKEAKLKKADIVLYGHTHEETTEYIDGIHILCPGSIRNGSYGIVNISRQGVICFTANLDSAI